ncbi:MAG: DNA repair protein RecN [Fimbriimonadaceae bacterium]
MVIELSVENVAIIERSTLSLGPGLTVLTGETGAGKSLLVDAIELALGERADSDLVRTGATRAVVSAAFDLSASPDLVRACADLGLELENRQLFIQREVLAEGRSQCRVAGKLVAVSALRKLGEQLVDLHGQHDHQSLLQPDRHGDYLDLWIGEPAALLLDEVRRAYADWDSANSRLNSLRKGVRDRERQVDMLRFLITEIESISPKIGEMEELEASLSRLQNVGKLADTTLGVLARMSDEEGSALERIGLSVRELEAAARLDPSLDETLSQVQSSFYSLQDALHELRRYADHLEADPQVLEDTAARIDSLKKLRRKYGDDEAAVLQALEEARAELNMLTGEGLDETQLEAAVAEFRAVLEAISAKLTALRTSKATLFSGAVTSELHELAMDKALFSARIEPRNIDATGGDRIEFFFSANPGESQRPLAKIASGGEISRTMLALKTVLAGKAGVPTLIFDEVDAGLSGKAAATVARKLEALSQSYQVIAISHLPQIASRALTHFRIEKSESAGRVQTNVRLLDPEERIEEIARMIAGETVTDVARANARELLGV